MHSLFERGMNEPDYEPAEELGQQHMGEGKIITVTGTHVEKVYTALDLQIDIEEKYDLDEVHAEVIMNTDDETGGTADVIAWRQARQSSPVETFAVGDLKTGDGHMVFADSNSQLLFYTWQAVEKYKKQIKFSSDWLFVLYIIQPSDRRDKPTDIWETDLKTIMDFGREFKQAQKMAKAGITEPCPGSHCSYCPAMATCPAKTGMVKVMQKIPKDTREMDDLQKAMSVVDEAEAWCRSVRKAAHEHIENGGKLDGFKLVSKRASRIWTEPDEAMTKFKNARGLHAEDYLDQKLKSAPQMEKVCKSKGIDFKKYESMISLHSSGTTLVKDSDKRPAALSLNALARMAGQLKK
jgi:hypothetical protein